MHYYLVLIKCHILSNRPAIDSGLSVSRIGSNAQCQLMKVVSIGIKNELTNYRLEDLPADSTLLLDAPCSNSWILFYYRICYINLIGIICL